MSKINLILSGLMIWTAAASAALAGDSDVSLLATRLIQALGDRDMATLAASVHPARGVRFSPYPFIDVKCDRVLSAGEVKGMLADNRKLEWGHADGTGEPIVMTPGRYLARMVFDRDFRKAPRVSVGQAISSGSGKENWKEVYGDGEIVEYYFPGSSQYAGMDWAGLRLIFQRTGGTWCLVGIVRNQWTI